MKAGKRKGLRRESKLSEASRVVVSPVETSRIGLWAFASAVALWLAFAPANLGFLGWFAPMGWVHASAVDKPLGRRGYWILWLSGCLFWLSILQGIRLAYWPLYFGWIALSLYLAVYTPLFVGTTRFLVHRKLPLLLAAPVAWVGLEMIRGYVLTGFSANLLVHTQTGYPVLIQIADQLSGYGVSFVMMIVCVAFYQSMASWRSGAAIRRSFLPVGLATSLFVATWAYGVWRLSEADRMRAASEPLCSILLVQENTPTQFDADLNQIRNAWTSYLETTRSLTAEFGVADVVVWPESTFAAGMPWVQNELPETLPDELVRQDYDREFASQWLDRLQADFEFKVGLVLSAASEREFISGDAGPVDVESNAKRPCLLLGSDAMEIRSDKAARFNTALFIDSDGKYVDRYDKMHRVMFGEYIPLGPVLQWLRDLFGMPGIDAGADAKCFEVNGVRIAPNICFESTMPRLIHWQVRTLSQTGTPPDILVNLTNDSWFRGSSILDHHFACSILCAVENRRPMLVAGNTGISAEIDASGRVLQKVERFAIGGLLAQPHADARYGMVQAFGYPLGWLCAAVVVWAVSLMVFSRFSKRSSNQPAVNGFQ